MNKHDLPARTRHGIRGRTLLEDFIFRQKLQRIDHERVRTLISAPAIIVLI
jgi:catalase